MPNYKSMLCVLLCGHSVAHSLVSDFKLANRVAFLSLSLVACFVGVCACISTDNDNDTQRSSSNCR